MTFKQALKIVHKLAASQVDSDEEIAALDEVQFHLEVMWDDEEEDK
tara:strand:- start:124 stop:261 length:138 start_codon:yes stop_codon:yes gene_type:complete